MERQREKRGNWNKGEREVEITEDSCINTLQTK